ncbi:MAG: hypothetical protein ACRCZF_16280, partial [Gemmataceae bacterium]
LFNLLQVQQNTARAISQEFLSIAQYNQSLALLEWSKGTIQQYNNVFINEGALPAHVQKKAADHFAAREAALKLREHPAELPLGSLSQPIPSIVDQAAPMLPGAVPQGMPTPAPAPTPNLMPAPSTKPMVPGEPAPSKTTQWPLQPSTTPAPLQNPLPTVPTSNSSGANEDNSVFRPIGTVKTPRRGEK